MQYKKNSSRRVRSTAAIAIAIIVPPMLVLLSKSNALQTLLEKKHSAFAVEESQEKTRVSEKRDERQQLAKREAAQMLSDDADTLREYYFSKYYFFSRSHYLNDWLNILVDADGAVFPYAIIDTSGEGIRAHVSIPVIRLIYRVVRLRSGEVVADDRVLETKFDLDGTFGLLKEETVREHRLPSPICMINVFYSLGKTTSVGDNRVEFVFRAAERLGRNPEDPEGNVPAIDWQITGKLISEQGDFAQFQFDATTTHDPLFYASNFETTSQSELITVEPTIDPGQDITIVVRKIIRNDGFF